MSEYNIGDRVKFVNEDSVYYRYEDMANKLTANIGHMTTKVISISIRELLLLIAL